MTTTFRKRKLPIGEGTTIRKVAEENEEEKISSEGPKTDVKDEEGYVKRNKQQNALSGGMIIKSDADEKTGEGKTLEKEIIVDGIALEDELDAERLNNPALVTVENIKESKKSTSRFGPSSAPAYVRATTIVDYKPDLCKDYNETGYCGYGDTCIYLHDRTTYVSGNILDQRWDEALKNKSKKSDEANVPSTTSPNVCGICKSGLVAPIVKTRCGHKFCRACAFERYDKTPTCATCGLQTMGIFNDVKL
jgi:hypothetical protein